MCPPRLAQPSGPARVSRSLTRRLPESASTKVMIATATGRRTPLGVITSATSLALHARTSTLS